MIRNKHRHKYNKLYAFDENSFKVPMYVVKEDVSRRNRNTKEKVEIQSKSESRFLLLQQTLDFFKIFLDSCIIFAGVRM